MTASSSPVSGTGAQGDLAALSEAATGGPWEAVEGAAGGWWIERPHLGDVAMDLHGENACFIVAMVIARSGALVPAAEVEALARSLRNFDCETDAVPSHIDVPDDYEDGVHAAGVRLHALLAAGRPGQDGGA